MIIKCTLSLPEHTTIIDQYHHYFGSDNWYEMEWAYPALPRTGEKVEGKTLDRLLPGHLHQQGLLPDIWQIADILWCEREGAIFPLIHFIGKWITN